MARRRKRGMDKKLGSLLIVAFILGSIFGAALASVWTQGAPPLQILDGGIYSRSMTIVGVDKNTGEGELATMRVELRAGDGDLAITVPPYENEDTQAAALQARSAVEFVMGMSLGQIDMTVSLDNISSNTVITGPSASTAVAILALAAARDIENVFPNTVRQDVVVSAAIDSTGGLDPVGEIEEKYQAVRDAGDYSIFIVARTQSGYLQEYEGITVERARNLSDLANIVLV